MLHNHYLHSLCPVVFIISCAKTAHDQHSSLAEHMHVFFSLALILSFNRNFCNVNNNSVNFLFSSFGYNKLIKTKTCCHTAASQFFLRKETRNYGNDIKMVWFQIRHSNIRADPPDSGRNRRHQLYMIPHLEMCGAENAFRK
jgi:hypothetical protein